MSKVGPEGRSFDVITTDDLRRLARFAADDREDFFRRSPDWANLYQRRFLCTALCQGAALHFVRGVVGINDFDVYAFFAQHPERPWYAKRRRVMDFGDPKFGRSADKPSFVGRRVDLMARGIQSQPGDDPIRAIQRYLASGSSETAILLAQKAVVLLDPQWLGEVVWLEGSAVSATG